MADVVDRLCELALSFDSVEEKVACAGTAIEQASFKTGAKSFLFAQRKGETAIVRLKLGSSLETAESSADLVGGEVEVGKGGWTTCRLPLNRAPKALLKRWVRESYTLSQKKTPLRKKA